MNTAGQNSPLKSRQQGIGYVMPLARLIYISENQIDPAQGSLVRQLSSILSASTRNNKANGITGALVFDDKWFLQALEGERRAVWTTYERIAEDERHDRTHLVELMSVPDRLFGNWWMGVATRTAATEAAFRPYLRNGLFSPEDMNAQNILDLMLCVSRIGLHREMRAAA